MENQVNLVDEMRYEILSRKLKSIGFTVIFGLVIIYGIGMFVAPNNINKDMVYLNLISVITAPVLCIASVYLRKMRLMSVTSENFKETYTGIHILSFFICDMAGLFAVITNLFINYNFIFATFGLLVTILYVWLNFPKHTDLALINNRSKSIPE